MRLIPRSPALRILLSLFLLPCLVVALDQAWVWHWRQIVISHDTSRILSPIEPDGCPDYLAALNATLSQGVTPENNAAPLLLQIIGTAQSRTPWQVSVQTLLAMDPAPLKSQLTTLYDLRKAAATAPLNRDAEADLSATSNDDEDAAGTAPWTPAKNPQLSAWIDANRHALQLLHAAITRPRYYVPMVTQDGLPAHLGEERFISLPIPRMVPYRRLASLALARAMARLDAGDFDGFRADLLDTARLARLLAQAPTLIEYLVARVDEERALIAIQGAAVSGRLSAAQTETLLHDLSDLPLFPSPAAQIDGAERYTALDAVCKFARHNSADGDLFGRSDFLPVDFNRFLRLTNAHQDAQVAAFAKPTYPERQAAFADLDRRENILYANGSDQTQRALSLFLTDLHRTDTLHAVVLAHRHLALTALALHARYLETHAFPAALTELPNAPSLIDPFTDKPLTYRRRDSGYLLYSFGPNQLDDGGTPHSPEGPAAKAYDLVVQSPPPPPPGL